MFKALISLKDTSCHAVLSQQAFLRVLFISLNAVRSAEIFSLGREPIRSGVIGQDC